MGRSRTVAGAAGVRERVLAAATELFAEQGYAATSVQQVVDRAGVTKGGLYHYFGAKEDLLIEMYRAVFGERLAALDRIIGQGRDPEWTLRAIIDDIVVGTAAMIKESAAVSRELAAMDSERTQRLQADWRRYQETVRGLIRDAQEAGVFAAVASPEIVSWSIFGVTNSLHTWYRPDGPKAAAAIAKELADLVLTGLRR
ncbi:TetR family transcriptional regulator [Catellatospora sp. IY07-71]|uniref:TetR/AcrR family transcriptional regulator n=1 Tax=Catellatospora sp. IY07-71 TaxID=2728827 RepID=UPI001BB3BF55|nr:TetR/AcrR family transcriptional regulator [Catellatospora sp. IY07-71]BCJ76610.1 TetR family transcriptional regulator [Catellatospora sp. IY07-71]